jgi:hypothetical protein
MSLQDGRVIGEWECGADGRTEMCLFILLIGSLVSAKCAGRHQIVVSLQTVLSTRHTMLPYNHSQTNVFFIGVSSKFNVSKEGDLVFGKVLYVQL